MKTTTMQNCVTTGEYVGYCFNYHNFADVNKLIVCTVQYYSSSSSICGLDPSGLWDSIEGGSARRKAGTYTEATRRDILDSNAQSQGSSGRRNSMASTARPL
jgi:hypothetical protein